MSETIKRGGLRSESFSKVISRKIGRRSGGVTFLGLVTKPTLQKFNWFYGICCGVFRTGRVWISEVSKALGYAED